MKRKRKNFSNFKRKKKLKYSVPDTLKIKIPKDHTYLTCFFENKELILYVIRNNKLLKLYSFQNDDIPWIMESNESDVITELPLGFKLPKFFCKLYFSYVVSSNNQINVVNLRNKKIKSFNFKKDIKDYCLYFNTLFVCTITNIIIFKIIDRKIKFVKEFVPFVSIEEEFYKNIKELMYVGEKSICCLHYFCIQCNKNNNYGMDLEHNISHDNFVFIGGKSQFMVYDIKLKKVLQNFKDLLNNNIKFLCNNNMNIHICDTKKIIELKLKTNNHKKLLKKKDIMHGIYYNEIFFYTDKNNNFGAVNLINNEIIFEKKIKKIKDMKIIENKIFIVTG